MERLTFRHDCPYNDFHGRAEPCEPINCLDQYRKKALDAVIDRLAVYEDTGLEPEEIVAARKAMKSALEMACEIQAYRALGPVEELSAKGGCP